MIDRAIPQPLRSSIYAYVGAFNMLAAFVLSITRWIIQVHVPGGYQLFAGPLGASWWCFTAAAVAISFASYGAAFILSAQGK